MPPNTGGGHRAGMSSEQRRVLSDLGVAARAPPRPSNSISGNAAAKPPVAPRRSAASAPAPTKANEDVVEIVRISQIGSGTSLASAVPAPRGRMAPQVSQPPPISIPNTVGQKNFVPPRRPHTGLPRMTPQPSQQRQEPMQAFNTPAQTPGGGTPVPGLQNARRVTQPPGGYSNDIFGAHSSPPTHISAQGRGNGIMQPPQPGFSAYNPAHSPAAVTGRFAHTPLPGSGVGALMGGNGSGVGVDMGMGSGNAGGDWQQQQRAEKQAKMQQQRAFLDEQMRGRPNEGMGRTKHAQNHNGGMSMGNNGMSMGNNGMGMGNGGMGAGADPNAAIAALQQQLSQLQMQQQQQQGHQHMQPQGGMMGMGMGGGMGTHGAPPGLPAATSVGMGTHMSTGTGAVATAGSDLRSIRQRNMGSSVFGGTTHYPSAAAPVSAATQSVTPSAHAGYGSHGMPQGTPMTAPVPTPISNFSPSVTSAPVPNYAPASTLLAGEDPQKAIERAKRVAQQQALKEQIAERERERERAKREQREEIDRERAAMGLAPLGNSGNNSGVGPGMGQGVPMQPNMPVPMGMGNGNGMAGTNVGQGMGVGMVTASPVRNPYQANSMGMGNGSGMGMGTPVNPGPGHPHGNVPGMGSGMGNGMGMGGGAGMAVQGYGDDGTYYNHADNMYNDANNGYHAGASPMRPQQQMISADNQYDYSENYAPGAEAHYSGSPAQARVREASKTRMRNGPGGADDGKGRDRGGRKPASGKTDGKTDKKGQFLGGRGGSRWDYMGLKEDGKGKGKGEGEVRKPKPRVSEIMRGKAGGGSGVSNDNGGGVGMTPGRGGPGVGIGNGSGMSGGTLVGESELMYGYDEHDQYSGTVNEHGYGYGNNGGMVMGGDPDLLSELPLYTGPGADNYNPADNYNDNGAYGGYGGIQDGYEQPGGMGMGSDYGSGYGDQGVQGGHGNNGGYTREFSQYNQY